MLKEDCCSTFRSASMHQTLLCPSNSFSQCFYTWKAAVCQIISPCCQICEWWPM